MGDSPVPEDVGGEETPVSFDIEFKPGEVLLLYQILSSAEMFLESANMSLYSKASGTLSRKVLSAMLAEEFKDAVSQEANDLVELHEQLMKGDNPISFQ